MTDDVILNEKEVFEQAGAGLVACLTLAAQSSKAALPVQGAMAMAGSLVGLCFGRSVYRAATRRFPKFARGFLSALDPDPARAGEKAKAMADRGATETLDDMMMRSFRLMMDAVDDEVVPVLGYLAASYGFERKRADVFFRGLGRVLCDLERGELGQLERIVKLLEGKGGALRVDRGAVQRMGRDPKKELKMLSAERIFSLMKREGLAKEYFPDADENKDPSDPFIPSEWVIVDSEQSENLARIVWSVPPPQAQTR